MIVMNIKLHPQNTLHFYSIAFQKKVKCQYLSIKYSLETY